MGIWDPTGVLSRGESLGTARGAILIDTSDVNRGAVEVRRATGDIEKSFERVGRSAHQHGQRAASGIGAIGAALHELQFELIGITAAAGGIAAVGIRSASSLQAARVQLTAMVGSTQAASRMMEGLRTAAAAAGIPFQDMLKASRLLLPTLEGNADQLDTYLKLARRVATLNPNEGIAGAAFAINEALASGGTDLISLSERFQISRFKLRDALAETGGDFAAALDKVLADMGITTEMADEMGRTFDAALRRAADAAAQLAGTAFEPLLNDFLSPVLEKTAEWLQTLQEADPALLSLGAGLVGVVAVGTPLLMFLGAVIHSLEVIRTLSSAGTLFRAGGVGIAAAGGIGLGVLGTRAIGAATGNEDLANIGFGDAMGRIIEFFKQLAVIEAVLIDKGMAPAIMAFTELTGIIRIFGATTQNALGQFLESMGQTIVSLGEFISQLSPQQGALVTRTGEQLQTWGQGLQVTEEQMRALAREEQRAREETAQWVAEMNLSRTVAQALYPQTPQSVPTGTDAWWAEGSREQNWAPIMTEDIKAAWLQLQTDLADIETQANEQRLDEEADYQAQKIKLIEQYGDRAAEIVEAREKKLAEIREQIADLSAAAQEREAEAAADHTAKMADLEAEAQQAEVRRLEDFQREEQRARAQHWLSLLQAASRLDARAIAEENERYALQQGNRTEDFDVETQRRAEQLAERLQQEQDSHEERLLEARRADERRLSDLQAALDEERALAAQRLEELAQERAEELAQLYNQHVERLNEIDQQERELSDQRQNAFIMQLNQLDAHYGEMLGIQAQGDAAIEAEFAAWLEAMRQQVAGSLAIDTSESYQRTPGGPGSGGYYQHGGLVDYTGLAMLHGSPGAPEAVLNPDTTAALGRMGWNYSQEGLLAMAGGASGGSRVINASPTIVLGDIGGHALPDIKRMVYDGMIEALQEIAGE